MAAISYSAGVEVENTLTSTRTIKTWISPSTMNSNDTVVVPTVTGKTVRILSCRDNTTGDAVTATVSSYTITVDAAGGTTSHVYVIMYMYV